MGKKHPDHPEQENRVKNNVKVKIELIFTKILQKIAFLNSLLNMMKVEQ